MANVIKPKRSTTPSKIPTLSDLEDGELAVNIPDKKLYMREGSSVLEIANASSGGGGSGSVAYIDGGSFTDTYVSAPFSVDGGGF